MNFNIIVAYCNNNGIGKNNNIPWNIPSDLKKFKILTKGKGNNCIIMGKKTWLSLNEKPLPGRDNLILSSSINKIENDNTKIFKNLEELLNYLTHKKYDELWVIGGSSIYNLFLNNSMINIDYIYITYIDKLFDCDTFFPDIGNKYSFISKNIHSYDFSYNTYDIIYKNTNI